MYFTIPFEMFLTYIVLLSYLPFEIEILLNNEEKLINYLRENEARFAQKLLRITSSWRSILHLVFRLYFCAIQERILCHEILSFSLLSFSI